MVNFQIVLHPLIPYFAVLVFFSLATAIARSAWFKGYYGELWVRVSSSLFLDKSIYLAIHDLTLPTPDGTTQIDHVFVSPYGVFVVETKNMSGWIFGEEKQPTWTQRRNRKSYKFQNPLRQNYKHIKTLVDLLQIPESSCHSVIVFTGNSTFKTHVPANVTTVSHYVRYIKSKMVVIYSQEEVAALKEAIMIGRLEPSRATARQHVRHIKSKKRGQS